MKAKAKLFKGIEYVVIDELPANQQTLLNSSPEKPERIKILIENKVVGNCIQYKDYTEWFQTIYTAAVPASTNAIASQQLVGLNLVTKES